MRKSKTIDNLVLSLHSIVIVTPKVGGLRCIDVCLIFAAPGCSSISNYSSWKKCFTSQSIEEIRF